MNPLNELLPAKARKVLYAIVFVAGIVLAAWQAAEGNWTLFIAGLVQAFSGALAGSNVTTGPPAYPALPETTVHDVPEEY
jgi:hypothetical protein